VKLIAKVSFFEYAIDTLIGKSTLSRSTDLFLTTYLGTIAGGISLHIDQSLTFTVDNRINGMSFNRNDSYPAHFRGPIPN